MSFPNVISQCYSNIISQCCPNAIPMLFHNVVPILFHNVVPMLFQCYSPLLFHNVVPMLNIYFLGSRMCDALAPKGALMRRSYPTGAMLLPHRCDALAPTFATLLPSFQSPEICSIFASAKIVKFRFFTNFVHVPYPKSLTCIYH